MKDREKLSGVAALKKESDFFHPGFSIDCVVLGFYKGVLRVLMSQFAGFHEWMLPGSFVFKDEDVDVAAHRILRERTGMDDVFLFQFHLFGDYMRKRNIAKETSRIFIELYGVDVQENHWYSQRFITVGYYALVDLEKIKIKGGQDGEIVRWLDLNDKILYYGDHEKIVTKALDMIRLHLKVHPIGRELLPEKFTMPELRILYETILGKSLDRRNFQRKILSFGYIIRLNEKRRGGAHKAPNLYCFDLEKYEQALKDGLDMGW